VNGNIGEKWREKEIANPTKYIGKNKIIKT
jgi:hypothetical protein